MTLICIACIRAGRRYGAGTDRSTPDDLRKNRIAHPAVTVADGSALCVTCLPEYLNPSIST